MSMEIISDEYGNGFTIDEHGLPSILDQRDTAHNAGFVATAYYLKGEKELAEEYAKPIKKVLWKFAWPFKHPTYWWSNSGSQNESENTWLGNWTYRFYHDLLAKIPITVKSTSPQYKGGIDIRKGMNGDQTSPMNYYFLLSGQKLPLLKFYLGLCCRAGFYTNGEHILTKPHHLNMLFRAFHLKPLYWLTDIVGYINVRKSVKDQETGNKIRDFLYLVVAEKQPTVWTKLMKKAYRKSEWYKASECDHAYWQKVFGIYWSNDTYIGRIISKNMPFGILS